MRSGVVRGHRSVLLMGIDGESKERNNRVWKRIQAWAGDVETPSVETPSEGTKFFGFDMDNEYIAGFDVGAWGTLL